MRRPLDLRVGSHAPLHLRLGSTGVPKQPGEFVSRRPTLERGTATTGSVHQTSAPVRSEGARTSPLGTITRPRGSLSQLLAPLEVDGVSEMTAGVATQVDGVRARTQFSP